METLLNYYNEQRKSTNLELEIRFGNVKQEAFIKIFNSLTGFIPEYSLNVIVRSGEKNHSSQIRKYLYVDGIEKAQISGVKKSELSRIYVDNEFSLVVSEEAIINPQSIIITGQDSLFRLKYRMSTVFANKWRLDMTKVRVIRFNEQAHIINIKKNFFEEPFLSINDTMKLEMELEYIDQANDAESGDVNAGFSLLNIITPDYKNQSEFESEIKWLSTVLGRKGRTLKQLTPQVISLTQNSYLNIYPPNNYYLTDKIDGEHGLAIIHTNSKDKASIYTISSKLTKYDSSKVDIPKLSNLICECEIVTNGETTIVYVFDVLVFNKKIYLNEPFSIRVNDIASVVNVLNICGINAKAKTFIQLSEKTLEKSILSLTGQKRQYSTDGLILIEPDKDYFNTSTYKWKPMENNTIDFLVKKAPNDQSTQENGKTLYYLFTTATLDIISKRNYILPDWYVNLFPNYLETKRIPLLFQPTDNPMAYEYYSDRNDLDNKICELRRDKNDWILLKIREDRESDLLSGEYFGNYFTFAEEIWQNYVNPFPLSFLYAPTKTYFSPVRNPFYDQTLKLHSYIKKTIIPLYKEADLVIDLGAGRGSDLNKYFINKVKTLVCVDNDANALSELVHRRNDIMTSKNSRDYSTAIYTILMDLSTYDSDKILNVSRTQADFVISQFAIHYFANDLNKLKQFISNLCKQNGYFCITCFDGRKVYDLVKSNPYIVYQNNVIKYNIKSKFGKDKFKSGLHIDILLPFTNGKLIDEVLLDVDELIMKFTEGGSFGVVENKNFDGYIDKYYDDYSGKSNKLTNDDLKFSSLYKIVILQKLL
jgi:SAM-dependent methyltransferase